MTLHIVTRSPYDQGALRDCLRLGLAQSAILLIEDAVYAAVGNTEYLMLLRQRRALIYALKQDVEARGLTSRIAAEVELVDYGQFVELCCQYNPIQTWY